MQIGANGIENMLMSMVFCSSLKTQIQKEEFIFFFT
jgi:hypothetical protein